MFNKIIRPLFHFVLISLSAILVAPPSQAVEAPSPVRANWRIMPVGDSITEGGKTFSVYRHPLWKKLTAAGFRFEYVGSKSTLSPDGPLAHEGYGGKNAEFLLRTVPDHFKQNPADIILLHAGHNYSVEMNPVPRIIEADEQLIAALRAINPHVIVLVAQVIPSTKLPKYSYHPTLNKALAEMAARLNRRDQPVLIVDQTDGFDTATDLVADLVHPNASGAEKMALRWFAALQPILKNPKP
jgi:lysophospholipase L1-like esterase